MTDAVTLESRWSGNASTQDHTTTNECGHSEVRRAIHQQHRNGHSNRHNDLARSSHWYVLHRSSGVIQKFQTRTQRCHQTCSVNGIPRSVSHLTDITLPHDGSKDRTTRHSSVKRRQNNRSNFESLQDVQTNEKQCHQTHSTREHRRSARHRTITTLPR